MVSFQIGEEFWLNPATLDYSAAVLGLSVWESQRRPWFWAGGFNRNSYRSTTNHIMQKSLYNGTLLVAGSLFLD